MAKFKINKKAMSNGAVLLLVGVAGVGGYAYLNNGGSVPSLPSQSVSTVGDVGIPSYYISSLSATNSSLFSITTSGVGADKTYLIEVDKDVLGNSARTETFTVGLTQDVAGQSGKNTIENYQKVSVPFASDLIMKDTTDVGHTFLSFSGSTFDGVKGYQTLTMQGATQVTKTLSLSINPNNADLTTLAEINDVGEFKTINFDFGQKNKVQLKLKN